MEKKACKMISTLLAGAFVSSVALSAGYARASGEHTGADRAMGPQRETTSTATAQVAASWRARNGLYFERNWGVDIVGVRPVSSGYMLRFDYRIVDPAKAAVLKDRKARPYLIDEKTRTALAVPAMENIGELRQVAPFELNRTYFMIFGNPGKLVKPGSRVTIVVGDFRAEKLVVD